VIEGRLPSQRLVICVNGVRVDEFTLSRRGVRACLVPWNLLAGAPMLDIAFTTPDAARLSDFAPGADRRQLGFAFESLLLYPSAHAEWQSGGGLSGPEPVPVDIGSILAADQMPLNELMLRFESLGQNCEFALLQRQCSAEPLGLLRFSSTPPCPSCWTHWSMASPAWARPAPSRWTSPPTGANTWCATPGSASSTTPGRNRAR